MCSSKNVTTNLAVTLPIGASGQNAANHVEMVLKGENVPVCAQDGMLRQCTLHIHVPTMVMKRKITLKPKFAILMSVARWVNGHTGHLVQNHVVVELDLVQGTADVSLRLINLHLLHRPADTVEIIIMEDLITETTTTIMKDLITEMTTTIVEDPDTSAQ